MEKRTNFNFEAYGWLLESNGNCVNDDEQKERSDDVNQIVSTCF